MIRQIVLDTETTGLEYEKGHKIIEIGCVELIDRRLTGNRFHRYINPGRNIELEALKIHGITSEFLTDKPSFSEVVMELFEFIQGAEIIAHNAKFDIGFIDYEVKNTTLKLSRVARICKIFDTLTLARQLHPGQKNSLDALCKRYHIDHFNRELHGALLDAEILAQVYLAMTGGQTSLFDETVQTINSAEMKSSQEEGASRVNRKALPIIYATPEELKLHQAFLELLRDKSSS